MAYPSAPPLDPDPANYVVCEVVDRLPIPAGSFFDWYWVEPVENFMLGTLVVAPITGVTTIPGNEYGKPGEPRIYRFKDGTIAYEHVLSTDFPRSMSYQSWGYTSPLRTMTDHAKVTLRALPDGENATKVVWTYHFHSRSPATKPLLKLFAKYEWRRNLAGALAVIREHLARHGTTRQIHQGSPVAA